MTHVSTMITENPFHSFTARADVPEKFNISRPNQEAMKRIIHYLEIIRKKKRETAILPIVGDAGSGKTHLFHALSEIITDAYVVYIPVPTNPNRVFSHIYFETIKAGGAVLLEYIADSITQKYQKLEHAAVEYPGMGNIVINAFFALKDPKQAKIALKWLTGFDLDEETIAFKRTIMDDEELALSALKIMLKTVDKPVIFFVDELESLFIALGPEAELQFLESLKKMHNEASNYLLCLACLTTLWDKILDLSSTAVQSRIEPPVILRRFTKKDIEEYSFEMLQKFHQKLELTISKKDLLWPLGKADIEGAYAYSHGNPREAIKWLAGVIEERKTQLLREVDNNQKFLIKLSNNIKKITSKTEKVSVGVLHKKNGTLISLSSLNNRSMVIIPPLNTLESIFHKSFWLGLKELLLKEEYDKIIIIGEKSEDGEFIDTDVKVLTADDYEVELKDCIDNLLKN